MRIAEYDDYLNSLSLKGLKEEAQTFDKSNRRVGLRILKLIAEKLQKSSSVASPMDFSQKYETSRYILHTEDYSSKRL